MNANSAETLTISAPRSSALASQMCETQRGGVVASPKVTSISLLLVFGVRADGQKVLLIKAKLL